MHMREDGRNGAGAAGRFGSPSRRVKLFDQNLVHAIVGGKNLNGGLVEWIANLGLTFGHGSLFPCPHHKSQEPLVEMIWPKTLPCTRIDPANPVDLFDLLGRKTFLGMDAPAALQ
jgi:hypothetical protein